MSGTELGKFLGVRQTQVSRYETGENAPTAGVLLRLLSIAEGTPEEIYVRNALYALMGSTEPVRPIESYLAELEQYKEMLDAQGTPFEITKSNALRALLSEIQIILADEELVDPLFVEIVRCWRILGKDPRAVIVFADLARYLEVNLVALRSRKLNDPTVT
jgi:transcriptional regulator with XRE-family HTH domain